MAHCKDAAIANFLGAGSVALSKAAANMNFLGAIFSSFLFIFTAQFYRFFIQKQDQLRNLKLILTLAHHVGGQIGQIMKS